MKVKVISELNTARGIVPTGQIIDIEPSLLERLKGKVEPLTDGRDLSHYCKPGDCWCSVRLPGSDYPAGCVLIKCEYYHLAVQEAPQTVNELQGILDLAT